MPRQVDVDLDWSGGQAFTSSYVPLAEGIPGRVWQLQNLRPMPDGTLWPRPSWHKLGPLTSEPTSKKGKGIGPGFYKDQKHTICYATQEAGGGFRIDYIQDLTGTLADISSSANIETAITITSPYERLPVDFAVGASRILYTNPGFPTKRIRYWDGTTSSTIATDNIAGRCIAYHLNRFWSGGSVDNPTYLRFTEIGDSTNWNTSENFIPVGQDDGLPIEAVVEYDRGMVVAKRSGLWWLGGSTLDSFQLLPIWKEWESGPSSPYGMVASDRGVFWVGRAGHAYQWDGGSVRRLHQEFFPVGAPFTSGATTPGTVATPGQSIAVAGGIALAIGSPNGTAGGVAAFDLDSGVDWSEYYENTSDQPCYLKSIGGNTVLAQVVNGSNWPCLIYRVEKPYEIDGHQDPNVGTRYSITTGMYRATEKNMTLRQLWLSVDYLGDLGGATDYLTVTPRVNGATVAGQTRQVALDTGTQENLRFDFALPLHFGDDLRLTISYGPQTTSNAQPTLSFRRARMRFLVDEGDR